MFKSLFGLPSSSSSSAAASSEEQPPPPLTRVQPRPYTAGGGDLPTTRDIVAVSEALTFRAVGRVEGELDERGTKRVLHYYRVKHPAYISRHVARPGDRVDAFYYRVSLPADPPTFGASSAASSSSSSSSAASSTAAEEQPVNVDVDGERLMRLVRVGGTSTRRVVPTLYHALDTYFQASAVGQWMPQEIDDEEMRKAVLRTIAVYADHVAADNFRAVPIDRTLGDNIVKACVEMMRMFCAGKHEDTPSGIAPFFVMRTVAFFAAHASGTFESDAQFSALVDNAVFATPPRRNIPATADLETYRAQAARYWASHERHRATFDRAGAAGANGTEEEWLERIVQRARGPRGLRVALVSLLSTSEPRAASDAASADLVEHPVEWDE